MRILIADAQPRVRFALRVLLERQPDLEVMDEAVDAERLLAQIEAACPDAVLLGWELPGMDMARLLSSLREACPDTAVIALSGRLEASRAAMSVGVDAFVSKSSPPEQLLAAITDCRCKQQDQHGRSGSHHEATEC
jgi:two-component system invasion response regulator UvrY